MKMADSNAGESGESEKSKDKESKWFRSKSKRSKVWKHFGVSRDGTQVKCDYCPLVLKKHSSTTNLWDHLDHAHDIKQNNDDQEPASTSGSVPQSKKQDQQSIEQSFAKTKRDPLNVVLSRLSADARYYYVMF